MTDAIQIVTTTPTRDAAQKIADALVARKLAAGVQVGGPIRSTYRWKGNVESADEWVCIIKTRRELYSAVESAIRELHSYEVPEILALPILDGSADYLRWIAAETTG